jgi:hypothetical protein
MEWRLGDCDQSLHFQVVPNPIRFRGSVFGIEFLAPFRIRQSDIRMVLVIGDDRSLAQDFQSVP